MKCIKQETKYKLSIRLFGSAGMEAFYLDSMLEAFKDGRIRDLTSICRTHSVANIEDRVFERLIDENYIKAIGHCYQITSVGLSFISEGGYTSKLIYNKLSKISVWFSLIALITSLIAFIRSFL